MLKSPKSKMSSKCPGLLVVHIPFCSHVVYICLLEMHLIDLFHSGAQIKYSSVLMLISFSSFLFATTSKFQKNICFKMSAVGLIKINTKECNGSRHL